MINIIKIFSQFFHTDKKEKDYFSFKKKIKSILFLKYTIIIITIFFVIYLIIPKIFNYEKKLTHLEKILSENYKIQIINYSVIGYNIFPSPHIDIKDLKLKIDNQIMNGKVESLKIDLNLSQIYSFKNVNIKKITLNNSELFVEIKNIKNLIRYIKNLNRKIYFKNSNLKLTNNNNKIININRGKFDNQNIKNLIFSGIFLEKKFKIKFIDKNNYKRVIFNLPEIGLKSEANLTPDSGLDILRGKIKLKILNNNFKFDFIKNKSLEIFNSNFRNSIIQTSYDGNLNFKPYFNFDLKLNSNYLNFKKLLSQINLNKDKFSVLNKKLNGKINFRLNKNNFTSQLIQEADISLFFKNGNAKLDNSNFKFKEGNIIINGFFTENQGYKKFKFYIDLTLTDSKAIIKNFDLDYNQNIKNKNTIKVDGSLNLSANKVNIKNIIINKNNIIKKEKTEMYEKIFEEMMIKNNVLDMLDFLKFKNFIKKIY